MEVRLPSRAASHSPVPHFPVLRWQLLQQESLFCHSSGWAWEVITKSGSFRVSRDLEWHGFCLVAFRQMSNMLFIVPWTERCLIRRIFCRGKPTAACYIGTVSTEPNRCRGQERLHGKKYFFSFFIFWRTSPFLTSRP